MTDSDTPAQTIIGTLNEGSLHAAIKAHVARDGDLLEQEVDGYVVDVVRDDLLIEIQTSAFYSIRDKLRELVEQHSVLLVYPIPETKWIVKVDPESCDTVLSRRKSPKHCRFADVFDELVRLPKLIARDRFSVQVLLTHEDEIRCADGKGSWRRKGVSILDRRLLEVVDERTFHTPQDLAALLPQELPESFTTRDLATAAGLRIRRARRMAYCLHKVGALERIGKKGRAYLYRVADHIDGQT